MPETKSSFSVLFGGWYQRTTLHLTEIYDFLNHGQSHPELDQNKLVDLKTNLHLTSVSREAGYLEYVQAFTSDNITIRYYEDGLYTLQLESSDLISAKALLENYYLHNLEPAISYIFSLGAPLPKIMANIKVNHPIVVSVITPDVSAYRLDETLFGKVYSQITAQGIMVIKTPQYIFVVSSPKNKLDLFDLMEMQIFFREFKDQLSKYLQIHRRIWEEISDIKDQKSIAGRDIPVLRARLDAYQKTINLISNRINQMGAYVHTRGSISHDLAIEDHLKNLFQYKFETLTNTLSYIKEIWSMTNQYLTSAISVLKDQETRATTNSIRSLQLITSIGVISSVLTYLTSNKVPNITLFGLAYFLILCVLTLILNFIVFKYYQTLRYPLKFSDHSKEL